MKRSSQLYKFLDKNLFFRIAGFRFLDFNYHTTCSIAFEFFATFFMNLFLWLGIFGCVIIFLPYEFMLIGSPISAELFESLLGIGFLVLGMAIIVRIADYMEKVFKRRDIKFKLCKPVTFE